MRNLEKYKGVIPAFYACYDNEGNVSPEGVQSLTKYFVEKGVKGVYVNGSSGECIYQSVEDRKIILENVMKAAEGKLTVIAHVACNNTKDSQELARHAESLGVDAIAAIPPIYFHLPEYAIAQYWNDISAAAPNTDFVIYNIPQLAGVALTQGLFAEMRKNPNVIGVKNSSMPVQDIQMFKQAAGPDYIIFNGPDEQFMSGRVIGAEGAIGGTYGVMPELIELGFKEYSGTNRGQAPYRRSDLLKLHIYGYLNKIRSSRSLEIECKRNLELMWLINAITPDHGTIAGFVKNNRKAFHVTLRNLTLILKGWGLIDGKLIAIDGTKIRAQNSKHNCITKSGLDKKIAYADEQINAYLMALEKDSQCEPEFKKKLEDYQELKKQYHQQKQALSNEGLEQKSLTDPDSRRMKNNGSLDICYNVQSAVDAQNHFVIDISTTNDINDQNQLYIMAKDASDLLETEECTVVADTGYYNASEIKNCLDDGMTVLIKKAKANNSTKDNEFRKDKFKYDPEKDVYICPAEQQLYFFENTSKNGMKYK